MKMPEGLSMKVIESGADRIIVGNFLHFPSATGWNDFQNSLRLDEDHTWLLLNNVITTGPQIWPVTDPCAAEHWLDQKVLRVASALTAALPFPGDK